ncbi:MAG: hypothetical protein QY330_01935 [Candidatus Dojkabacteria bacterium]|uniref:Uncharacterized protein n=1 Tax=Candidatus Dojkabacteria bacterium TaxID=2099670 RepID=A0A952AKU2_9BACT|nr:hypothetical protein [Candidatus Dojkabacteria bacterium]WKZ28347.1 MAG: hypothetical protein QY330_01935 [Candidatus Dojkabacteria bacterium]
MELLLIIVCTITVFMLITLFVAAVAISKKDESPTKAQKFTLDRQKEIK